MTNSLAMAANSGSHGHAALLPVRVRSKASNDTSKCGVQKPLLGMPAPPRLQMADALRRYARVHRWRSCRLPPRVRIAHQRMRVDEGASRYQPLTDLLLGTAVSLAIGLAKYSAERVHRHVGELRRLLSTIATADLTATALDAPMQAACGEPPQRSESLRSLVADLAVMGSAVDAATDAAQDVAALLAAASAGLKEHLQQQTHILEPKPLPARTATNTRHEAELATPAALLQGTHRDATAGSVAADVSGAANAIAAASRRFQVIVIIIENLASRCSALAANTARQRASATDAANPQTASTSAARSADSIDESAAQLSQINQLMTRVAFACREHANSIRHVSNVVLQVDAITQSHGDCSLLERCASVVQLLEQQTTALRSALTRVEAPLASK